MVGVFFTKFIHSTLTGNRDGNSLASCMFLCNENPAVNFRFLNAALMGTIELNDPCNSVRDPSAAGSFSLAVCRGTE